MVGKRAKRGEGNAFHICEKLIRICYIISAYVYVCILVMDLEGSKNMGSLTCRYLHRSKVFLEEVSPSKSSRKPQTGPADK